jgi:hypothetical protein
MTTHSLHTRAMDVAETAFLHRFRGNDTEAHQLFVEAYALEKEAALALEHELKAEPTRSVLFRSAASLALNAGAFQEAERMIFLGLLGEPPHEIAEEMRDLLIDLYLKQSPKEDAERPLDQAMPIELRGRLGYADATRNRIRLIDEAGQKVPYYLEVHEDMADLIKQHWNERVYVRGLTWPHTRHITVQHLAAEEE